MHKKIKKFFCLLLALLFSIGSISAVNAVQPIKSFTGADTLLFGAASEIIYPPAPYFIYGDGGWEEIEINSNGEITQVTYFRADGTLRGYSIFYRATDRFFFIRIDFWYEGGVLAYYVVNELDSNGDLSVARFYFPDGTLFDVVFNESNAPVLNAEQPIMVFLDGWLLEFDVPPTIIDNRTMVPMRVIFEALGAEVYWNGVNQSITATTNNLTVFMAVGVHAMYINGLQIEMDVPPVIIDRRTLVPARLVAEAFGAEVIWNREASTVFIFTPILELDYDWWELDYEWNWDLG